MNIITLGLNLFYLLDTIYKVYLRVIIKKEVEMMETEKIHYLSFMTELAIVGIMFLVIVIFLSLLYIYIPALFWLYVIFSILFVIFMVTTLISNALKKARHLSRRLEKKSDHF